MNSHCQQHDGIPSDLCPGIGFPPSRETRPQEKASSLIATARWAEVWGGKGSENFPFFFFHESPRRSHPSRLCSCLPSLYGHIGFCSAGKFYCFCCSAPASFFFFFVAMNKNHSSLSVPFPNCNSGVLMSFTLSSHPPFLLLLTMAFLV